MPHSEGPINTNLFDRLGDPLPIEYVEFRVQSISAGGWATLLAYKDARVDMDRLDQVVGRGFWTREHVRIDGREYCKVGIWNWDIQQWVHVMDLGTPSNSDAEKGEASDAFKRACFNLGIGRELYAYPLILVQLKENEFTVEEERGKKKGKATFGLRLKDWVWMCTRTEPDVYGKTQVAVLAAIDDHMVLRYEYPRKGKAGGTGDSPDTPRETSGQGGAKASAKRGAAPSAASGESAGAAVKDKPWFDDFDAQKGWFLEQFSKGHKADSVLAKLSEKYKINKATENKIRDLAVATTAENLGSGGTNDDVPL